eukprot:COSAG02_NODE_1019_length_15171_cov_7.663482_4_plen_96_part_00
MLPNWSEEVFRVTKVTKQKSKGLGNASFLYQIERTNGDAVWTLARARGNPRLLAAPLNRRHVPMWGEPKAKCITPREGKRVNRVSRCAIATIDNE